MKTIIIYTIAIMCWMAWRFFTLLAKFSNAKRIVIASVVLLTTCSITNAQTIYGTFAPGKLGYGAIYEQPVSSSMSLLAGYDKGTYKTETKFSSSTSFATIEKYGAGIKYNWFMAMFQYNNIVNYKDEHNQFNLDKVHKYSIELGATVDLSDKITSGLMCDVFNFEPRIIVGFRLR